MSKRCMGCMELYGDEFEICPFCGYVDGTEPEEAIHMEPGMLLRDRYVIGKVLGYGGFGVTYIGWDGKLEQKVAIKEYLPGEFSTRMPGQSNVSVFNGEKSEQFRDGMVKFVDEAKRLAKFQNEPGIVKIFDSFEENGTAYIIMEYLEGETLAQRLKREKTIPEEEAVQLLMPVMRSLITIHAEGILHRDIAPDNIFLLKNGEVKLIDFGASRYATTSHSRSLTVIIKPGYSPEEQYRSRGDQGPYTDVYALAATLYKMVTGKTPPDAMERRAKIENQKKEILENPTAINKNLSINREIAILNAMNVRIEDRTQDMEAFIQELNADPPAKRRYGQIKRIDFYGWPLWLKIALPVCASILILLGVLLSTGVINFSKYSKEVIKPDEMVVVPDVEGMAKDEAIALLKENLLNLSAEGNIDSPYIKAGVIVLQSPVGGTYLEKNGTVVLKVSAGGGVVASKDGISTVPYVVWNTEEDARAKLIEAGLSEPKIELVNDEDVAEGNVISQSIEAGNEVEEGTQITLVVSLGPAAFGMPDVVDKAADTAEQLLVAKGLMVTKEYEKNNSIAEGNVFEQSIAAGEEVKKGTSVTIKISSGKQVVNVPNVSDKSQSDAKSMLENLGFKVSVVENYSSSVARGRVISTNPAADSGQLHGTTITITVSKGPQTVTVYFDGNQGSSDKSSGNYEVGAAYGSLPNASRGGYTFLGWYTAASGGSKVSSSTTVTQKDNYTLYAQWTQNAITVSFDANGGNLSGASSMQVYQGGTYGGLPSASRTTYTFAGWYTDANGGSQVTSSSIVSNGGNHTLYAHWSANGWSDWVTSLPSGVSSSGYNIETKKEYRSKTRSTTTSSSSSMSGWTQTGSSITGWGSWSAWQNNAVSESASRQVETQTIPATTKTQYKYSRYYGVGADGVVYVGPYVDDWGPNMEHYAYCNNYEETISDTRFNAVNKGAYIEYNGNWYNEQVITTEVTPAYTQYRYRDAIYTYTYEKWSDWSGWSSNAVSANSNTKVETRDLYRYQKK